MSFHNRVSGRMAYSFSALCSCLFLMGAVSVLIAGPQAARLEPVPESPKSFVWVGLQTLEGHLAVSSSPDGAFAPDSSSLAVADGNRVLVVSLKAGKNPKSVQPRLENITDLNIEAANFVGVKELFLLGTGIVRLKGKRPFATPMLGFQWDMKQDALLGKIADFGVGGGFGRPRYLPAIGYLSMYKNSSFTVWNPVRGKGGLIKIPDLKREPNLSTISPDGHWLLLAQIAGSGTPDPVVVQLSEHKFVNSLAGHGGPVLGMAFSRDSSKVVTACADGKVRIWSVEGWKLIETLSGHHGPVHWAEFSPDGQWVASAGEDNTVRIWAVHTGKLVQTLRESTAPVLTVGFSPDGSYLAASTEHNVLMWQKNSIGP